MFNKAIKNLTFEDIDWLIKNAVVENQNLEYKKEVWGRSDSEKKEMLKDIVSMANRHGGYIIVGIEEDENTSAAKNLFNVPDAENEKDRILSSLYANTQPRLQSVKIEIIGNNNINVLVINVPNSFKKPHMITFSDINQFWVRHDRQKMRMTIDEIQEAIISRTNINKDIDSFFAERNQSILLEHANQPMIVIGAFPISAEKEIIDISDMQLRDLLAHPPKIRQHGVNFEFLHNTPKPSYYGLSVSEATSGDTKKIELHRNGYIEGCFYFTPSLLNVSANPSEQTIIRNWAIMEIIFSFTKQLQQIYSFIGYDGQVYLFCNLYNIKNFSLSKFQEDAFYNDSSKWIKDHLTIGPLAFTEINEIQIAKTIGDRIWQSFGFEKEPYFDNGVFTLK